MRALLEVTWTYMAVTLMPARPVTTTAGLLATCAHIIWQQEAASLLPLAISVECVDYSTVGKSRHAQVCPSTVRFVLGG